MLIIKGEDNMTDSLFSNSEVFMGDFVDAEDIFGDAPDTSEDNTPEKEDNPDKEKEKELPEGDVSAEDLFGDDEDTSPESVGDDEDIDKEDKEAKPKGSGSSPKGQNLYSSFAQALYGDGLFQFLDEETVNNVSDADTFAEMLNKEVDARLDETTKRVNDALNAGVQPNVVAQYERTIKNLENITESALNAETEEGRNLRRTIIKQDFINRGFSSERAEKNVDRIMSDGTDIEDAKEALESVTDYFKTKYQEVIDAEKAETEKERQKVLNESKEFKKAIFESKTLFDDIPIDRQTRQKAYDAMINVAKVTEDGEKLTAVQLYADEHPVEFRVMLGTVYALTDGFTKMGNLLNKSVSKKVNKNLQDIERKFQNQRQGGSFRFAEGDDADYTRSSGRKRLDID